MNKIYKIVWSKAKHAYVVTSEVARSHTKSASGKAVKAALAAAVGMGVLMGGYAADAADTATGSGNGVAYGTGSSAPEAENVAVGKDAHIDYSNGTVRPSRGDIAVGNNAHINNYVNQGGGIAIGQNAFSENMAGVQEKNFNFGQTTFTGSGFLGLQSPFIPANPDKVVTGVAIGQNAYARSGSVMVGTHNFKGKLYDTTVDTSDIANMRSNNVVVNATTVGTNSWNNAAFGVVNGAYSAITGAYDGGGFRPNSAQNFGATITGSLNSIESKTASSNYSGIANSIVGVANRTFNSNGSLIYGAGNEITNSVEDIYSAPTSGGNSPEALAQNLRRVIKESNGGGSTMAFGGGNRADYTLRTAMIGVNNTVTGTSRRPSTYNSITGFKNAATNVNHVSVIGSENEIENTDDALVLGNKRKLAGANGSVILGSGDSVVTTNVENAVSIGHNANVQKAGGVALGSGSVASVDKGVAGYDPSTKATSTDTSSTWKATEAAVSVGDTSKGITRQITGVAAGAADTDAVNVAQLKKVEAKAEAAEKKHTTVKAGDYATVTEGTNADGGKEYTVSGPKMESTDGTVKITDKVENGKKVGYNLSVDTSKLGIKDMHVKEGTATYQADGTGSIELTHQDGQKATVTGLKDTRLKEGTGALTLSGNTLSMKIEDTSGKKVTGSVDLSAIAGQIDTNTTYTMSGKQNADNTTTITLKGSDGKENKVTVATKDTRNTVKAGENVTLATAANTFGGTEYTVNVKADGKVENGNTKIVSGNTVYHETHVKNDGNYVKKENSAGDNLTILDKQVGNNTTNITNLGNTINNLNGKLGTLDNRISKVGAGAAALAALHPLDFDPHDKWDIAAGFGNYRNASAAAVGLFYRPNERTMMSLGWTMGDDRNMINAGVSVKLGRGDVYTRYSKVEMANRIEAQNKRINDMESELEELKAQIAALAAKK